MYEFGSTFTIIIEYNSYPTVSAYVGGKTKEQYG